MKRTLAALLAVLMTMLLWVEPARAADQPLEVSLKTPIEKITTRHIQELELSVKNSENQPRKVRLVMALVDYKGNVFSRAVSELTLKEKGSDAVKEHLKILPKAYEVRVFAEDTAGKILSNTLRLPIEGGYSVKDIASVQEIQSTVPQWSVFTMPEMVEATMYTGEVEYVAVQWDGKPDMARPGIYRIRGKVENSKVEAWLVVTVLAADQITKVNDLAITVEQGARFTLPVAVPAEMRSGRTEFIPTVWDKAASTSRSGTFTYQGRAAGGKKLTLTLTVQPVNDSAVYTFRDEEVGAIIAEEYLDCDVSKVTRGMLKTISSLNLSYTGSESLEDLRYCTSLKSLTMQMTDSSDLSPLADLRLQELDLYACGNVKSIAPIANLTSLRTLKLNASGVTDYSPAASYYGKLTDKDFSLSVLSADSEGHIDLTVTAGKSYQMPFQIRLSDGSFDRVDWNMREIPAQEEGSLTVEGTAMLTGKKITVDCTVAEREDYAITWHDEALEKGVRKAIDKPYGTIYYSDVKYLRELDCFALGIRSLQDLAHMRNLTYLGVAANYLDDSQWQYVKHLTKLEYLDVAMNQFTYIPAGIFEGMSSLKELCADENKITRIEKGAFYGLEHLENLLLEDNPKLKDLSEARTITYLKALMIRNTQVSDISFLSGMQDLEEVWASNCPISDLSCLKGKTKLYRLHLGNDKNQGKITDISCLSSASGLYWLEANGNQISDISCLKGKTKLMHLEIENNRISDLSPLSDCRSLDRAFLKNNQITSVAPLEKLTQLESLYLQNNRISDVTPLAGLKSLKNLYLSGNPISDYSALKEIYPKLIGKDFYV